MFKSRKKRQQQKELIKQREQESAEFKSEIELTSNYKLLDDIHLTHDFRSSIILPELNKDLDPAKLSKQQLHLAQLRDMPNTISSPETKTPPLSPPGHDGTKQYEDLAAWRHLRSQNRYSNGLFGGKQRGRPKPNQIKKHFDNQQNIEEDEEEEDEEEEEDQVKVELAPEVPQSKNQLSIIQQLALEDDKNDSEEEDDDEEEEVELLEEMYEPNSDEENYFFQDFSANSPTKKKTTRNKSRRSNKALSRFDLSSFARDLHDHRLSVVQRESRIIMTEDDELELEKLLERQRQRMSMMTMTESTESLVPAPPMPSLDLLKAHTSTATIYRPSSPPTKESTLLNDDTIDTSAEQVVLNEINNKDEVPQEKIIYTKPTAPVPTSQLDKLKRSASTNSMTNSMRSYNTSFDKTNLMAIPDEGVTTLKPANRKSLSMDDIHINEHSVTSAALDWITENETVKLKPDSDPTSFNYKQSYVPKSTPTPLPQLSKSRSLFGSLRQVSRSKSSHHHAGHGGGIKGLVRNFSSHKAPTVDNDAAGMSRAAMAVIQHNVAKQEKQKISSVIPKESKSQVTETPTLPQRRSRSKSDAASNNNLISQLISRAASNRKHQGTKIVNMEDEATAAAKKRAQVVRRTIIYVQPDSLRNLKKSDSALLHPLPPKINTRNTMASSDGSLSPDDETIRSREYVTATKIMRQTSVRKRIVEDTESASSSPLSESSTLLERQRSNGNSRKRYQLQSVEEKELMKQDHSKHFSSGSSSSSNKSDYLEGVELREMSDGSVVWGLVKKEGNRKSFYRPDNQIEYEQLEDDEESISRQQHNNSLSPPPIPKRSPRRRPTQADVYYSNDVTLPHLLKMVQEQHPGDDYYDSNEKAMSSVDDQLDDMMRFLTSQQH